VGNPHLAKSLNYGAVKVNVTVRCPVAVQELTVTVILYKTGWRLGPFGENHLVAQTTVTNFGKQKIASQGTFKTCTSSGISDYYAVAYAEAVDHGVRYYAAITGRTVPVACAT